MKLDVKEKDRLISGFNYDVWVFRMRDFFREVKLWLWVNGSEIRLQMTEIEKRLLMDGEKFKVQEVWDILDERV